MKKCPGDKNLEEESPRQRKQCKGTEVGMMLMHLRKWKGGEHSLGRVDEEW